MRSGIIRSAVGALALAGLWTAYTQNAPTSPLSFKQLKDDLWVIEGTSKGSDDAGNIAVLVTNEGVILVDDRFTQDFPEVMAAVRKISPLPVKYVVNTHHHGDHTGGNALMSASAQLLIQANARKHMIDTKMPGPPSITFTREGAIFLG